MDQAFDFQGARILVVEDDMMIAIMVEDMLADFGCEVVGPANTLSLALTMASDAVGLTAAILDVHLGAESVFPLADLLRAQGVPLIYCTGHAEGGLRDVDRGCPVLRKPYRADDLGAALSAALAAN